MLAFGLEIFTEFAHVCSSDEVFKDYKNDKIALVGHPAQMSLAMLERKDLSNWHIPDLTYIHVIIYWSIGFRFPGFDVKIKEQNMDNIRKLKFEKEVQAHTKPFNMEVNSLKLVTTQ